MDAMRERALADEAAVFIDELLAAPDHGVAYSEFVNQFIDAKIARMSDDDRMEMEMSAVVDSVPMSLFTTVKLGLTWEAARVTAARMWELADRNAQQGF